MNEGWKIRHVPSGLYCPGGGLPGWRRQSIEGAFTVNGKTWNRLHHVEAHMRQSMGFYRKHHAELELVRVELVEAEVRPMSTFLPEFEATEAEKIRKAELQNKQRRLEYLRKQQAQTEQEIEELS